MLEKKAIQKERKLLAGFRLFNLILHCSKVTMAIYASLLNYAHAPHCSVKRSGIKSAMVVLAKNKNYMVLQENELMISGKYKK